ATTSSAAGGASSGSGGGGGGAGSVGSAGASGSGGGADAGPDASDGAPMPGDGGASQLRIYWVDVEGGAATVIATPNGQTIVVDAGFPGSRDANRVANLLKNELRVTKIDYMLTTHYH